MPPLTVLANSEESNASDSNDEALVAVPTIDLDDLPPDPHSPMNQPSEDEYTGAHIEYHPYLTGMFILYCSFFYIGYRGSLRFYWTSSPS